MAAKLSKLGTVTGTIIRLLLLCLVVGIALRIFNISPRHIFDDTWNTLAQIVHLIVEFARWAIEYVALGAVIVLPIAVIALILRLVRR
jgi:hypothetical protein